MVDEPTVSEEAGPRASRRFGPYLLRRLLGRGGFGEVYEAEDTAMGRVVALKLLGAVYSQNPTFRERLFREAHTAGRLHDPHVVPIHGCGEIDGQLYIDMRLIDGTDLQTVLDRGGPLDPARAVGIVAQIAAALDAAHADTVIHRDVKPANILLARDDFACLVDFGLANAASDAKLTTAGTTIGTFAYLAPERITGDRVDHRADIYALACVLYECLTGAPPYASRDGLPALVAAHLSAPIPRPSQQRAGIPAGFDEVIARGMAKTPDDRYPSAGQLAAAAHRALSPGQPTRAWTPQHPPIPHGRPATAPPPPPPSPPTPSRPRSRRRTLAALAALTTIAVIATVAAITVAHRGAPTQHAVTTSTTPHPTPTTAPPLSLPKLPFGQVLPEAVAVDTGDSVYTIDWSNGATRVLELAPGATTPTELPFTGLSSPHGVAVDTAGNVYVADTGNSRVLKLAPGATTPTELPFTGLVHPEGVAVDPADNLYVADTGNIRVLKLAGGATTELSFNGVGQFGGATPSGVAVDPAGDVYVTVNDLAQGVWEFAAGAAGPTQLPFGDIAAYGVAVDAGRNIYVTDRSRVLKMTAGTTEVTKLPNTGFKNPRGLAVDKNGNLYITNADTDNPDNNGVFKLAAG